jgi:hypothetical protein
MTQDRLTKAIVRRLKELGLPPSLIDVEVFRDKFFLHRWVMFVRDGDEVINVHLMQPGEHSRDQPDVRSPGPRNLPG